MNLNSNDLIGIVVALIVVVAFAGVGMYLLQRLRRRRELLRSELAGRPEVQSDRAFNRLAMARHEAEIVARQGVDVTAARTLISSSQAAFDSQRFDEAYRLAHSAHEALVLARRDPPGVRPNRAPAAESAPLSSGPTTAPAAASEVDTSLPAPEATAAGGKIPKNRAESQFQLRLLAHDLERAQRSRSSDGSVGEANGLLQQAQAAFDRGDFTDAFRLALRGRRQAGGSVEGLGPPLSGRPGSRLAEGPSPSPDDPSQVAARVASSERCGRCGAPLLPEDGFCRGCGAPRAPSKCPQCGAPRRAADAFCGKCGANFS